MIYNVAILKAMQAEGLDLDACIRVLEAGEKRADPTAAERKRRQRAKSRRDVTRDPPNDNTLTPEVSEAKASSPKYPAPEGVEENIWVDFLASPKRRKAGMNATAYAGIANNLKALAENGFPPGEMIALAVERGWTTVKLEWVKNDGQQRNQHHPNIGKTTAAIAALGGFHDDRPM